MSSSLDIDITTGEADTVIVIRGELDADNCAALGEKLPTAPDHGVVVDMSGVQFIDSSGISEVLRLRDRVTSNGGTVVVSDPSPQVRKVLEITGLLEMFGLHSAP